MKCKRCNGELADDAKFCSHCGAVAEQRCPNEVCGKSGLPAEALFCPDCGTRLVAEQEHTAWRSPDVATLVHERQRSEPKQASGKAKGKQLASLRYVVAGVALVAVGLTVWLLFPHFQKAVLPLVKPVPQNFVLIRGGEFTMGSPMYEGERRDNETQHQVKLSDYYISKYEVTVGEFKQFIDATNYPTDAEKGTGDWSGSWVYDGKEWNQQKGINWRHDTAGKERPASQYNHPVVHVSWNDAVAYCEWRSAKEGKTYRLPTEAEWEYACRAGSKTPTPFNTGGNLTTAQANYDGNYPYGKNSKGKYRGTTVAVNSFAPNAWGLYNMHGNVWEWCSDWYGEKYYEECKAQGVVENPQGAEGGKDSSDRVVRGGGWYDLAERCRSATRIWSTPGDRDISVGFRLVFVP